MSYSFSVNAPDRAALLAAVSAKFDEIVAQQPVHRYDRDHVEKTTGIQLGLLGEPLEGQCFFANINGYLSWRAVAEGELMDFTGFSAGVAVSIGTAPTAVKPA